MPAVPYELLIRLHPNPGFAYKTFEQVGNRGIVSDPLPLTGVEDPTLVSLAEQFSLDIAEDRDAKVLELADKQAELDAANAQIATLQTRVAELESLAGVADTDYVPMHGLRKALRALLVTFNGVEMTALAAIEAYINDPEHLEERADLRDDFEYAPYVKRDHPSVLAMQALLQKSDEEVDALFVSAKALA